MLSPRPSHHQTTGTLSDAELPGAAFGRGEFGVALSQTSLAEADEILKDTLEEALDVVGGNRAFLALVDASSGELVLRFTAGEGWTDEIRRRRVSVQTVTNIGSSRRGITRHVVINGRAYWTGDVSSDPHYIGFFDDVKSEIALPLIAPEGGVVGVINIESPESDCFGESHAKLLEPLCRRAAIVVAMAEHQLREEALVSIGRDFNSAADVDALIHDVVEQATLILRADDCSLFLMDEATEMLELAASHGPLEKEAGRHTVKYRLGEGLTGWVAQNKRVIRVGDPRTDARWKGLFSEAPPSEIAALMAVPVYTHRLKPGVLRVVRHRKGSLYFLPQEFTRADEDVLVTLAGQLAVAIDRTRLTERLLRSERMAAWGEMSARAAHMIGNTVFGVKGHLSEVNYILKSKADDPDADWAEMRDLMGDVTRGIYRLEGILGEFRDFVLATQLHTVQCDINQILRNVTAETFPKHSEIDLLLNLSPDLPPMLADEVKLKRAFGELIENSIDFQPEGGQLSIRSALVDPKTLSFNKAAFPGRVVKIDFADRGPGLTEQDRERVFQAFYSKKAKGMGLGLSIVKGVIEAHGGAIYEVGNEDAPGAHFVVLLPVRENEKRERSGPASPQQVFGGG